MATLGGRVVPIGPHGRKREQRLDNSRDIQEPWEGECENRPNHTVPLNDESCVIELRSLAAKKLTAKKEINFDANILCKRASQNHPRENS
jgi:hypothetical protein